MLSRVADALFWMTRYVERAENIARMIDVNLHLNLDSPNAKSEQWQPLVDIMADDQWFDEHYEECNEENTIKFLAFDTSYPNSIIGCLRSARENARSIREIISSEMWEQINTLYLFVNDAVQNESPIDSPYIFFRRIRMSCHLFFALTDATMSHGEGWHFGQIGKLLERSDKTSRILDIKYFLLSSSMSVHDVSFDTIQWAALLRSVSALEMYRKKWRRIDRRHVADFLILDVEFPRAIHHCLIHAENSLHEISGTPTGTYNNPAEKLIGRLRSELDFKSVDDIIDTGLHDFLDELQVGFNEIGAATMETFFEFHPHTGDTP